MHLEILQSPNQNSGLDLAVHKDLPRATEFPQNSLVLIMLNGFSGTTISPWESYFLLPLLQKKSKPNNVIKMMLCFVAQMISVFCRFLRKS